MGAGPFSGSHDEVAVLCPGLTTSVQPEGRGFRQGTRLRGLPSVTSPSTLDFQVRWISMLVVKKSQPGPGQGGNLGRCLVRAWCLQAVAPSGVTLGPWGEAGLGLHLLTPRAAPAPPGRPQRPWPGNLMHSHGCHVEGKPSPIPRTWVLAGQHQPGDLRPARSPHLTHRSFWQTHSLDFPVPGEAGGSWGQN